MRRRLILLLAGVFACLLVRTACLSAAAAADSGSLEPPTDLPTLMAALAKVEQMDAIFEESKEMTALETPLVSRGFLRYRAPNVLEKEVLQPQPALYRIDGDRITVDGPAVSRRDFSIDQYPGVRTLVESVRATLAGDEPTLERYFRVAFLTDASGWQLRLEPLDQTIARQVVAIIIGGTGNSPRRVETLESGGDRTVMTITPVTE